MPQRLAWIKLLALVSCLGASLQPPAEEADEFHFVVLGDAQLHNPTKFNRIVDQTRRLRPAFVIQVGDLIEGYHSDLTVIQKQWQRFAQQIEPLGPISYIAVPGNHDVFNGEKKVDPRLESMFEETWGPLYFSFVYKNTLLVGLNSDSSAGANRINGEQLKWLKRTLSERQHAHTFIFMHRPPALLRDAEALHQLFVDHGVSHVFYGHHHHYHFYERDGIAYIMTNAAATSAHDEDAIGSFHHLLQVSVRGAEVDVAVIKADAILAQNAAHPQDNYDFFDLSRKLAPRSVRLEPTNQQGTYTLNITLRNTSKRDIAVFAACTSADHRWQITPKTIPTLSLKAGAQETLSLSAGYAAKRVPESTPACQLKVPFQTVHGQWLDFEHQIRTRY